MITNWTGTRSQPVPSIMLVMVGHMMESMKIILLLITMDC